MATIASMHSKDQIKPVADIIRSRRIRLPESAGLYAFWWIGDKTKLLKANRNIVLKGPSGRLVSVEYKDWWPDELSFPCLYVGKSTNIKKRFSLHIKSGSRGRLHEISVGVVRPRAKTTSCQLRFGIENIFPDHPCPIEIISENVGFSFSNEFSENTIEDRFFGENRLIGVWKPWFNVDSER